MSEKRFARQVLMFGEEGQKKVEAQTVGVVGGGGLGLQVIQALAYTGVKKKLLGIDDDHADETNLNRLAGAGAKDVGRPKMDIARDHVNLIDPNINFVGIPKNLRSREAIEALIGCSVIFGCVDHDGPRLVLTELAAAYEIPLIDVATEIFPEKEGQPFHFGGRVIVARPGDYCLICADQLDLERAKEDLETPEVRALRRKHNYGIGSDASTPSVFALNGILSNLAVMEFIAMVTGIREPVRHLTYKGDRGVVTSRDAKSKPDCFTCMCVRGQREQANIWRYLMANHSSRAAA
jgi:molybdopterin-synthase adenylyltransferase